MSDFPPKLPKIFRSQYAPAIWTTAPRSTKPTSFKDGLLWARNLGEAAATGYSVVYRQPNVRELFAPTPAYWVSLLHKHLMGRTVLNVRQGEQPNSFVYAHCAKKQNRFSRRGAVTVLVLNMGTEELNTYIKFHGMQQKSLEVQSYILTTADESSSDVLLNGQPMNPPDLHESKIEFMPKIRRAHVKRMVDLNVPARSVGFFVLPGISLPVCKRSEEEPNLIREEIFEDQNGMMMSENESEGSETSASGVVDVMDSSEFYKESKWSPDRKRPSVATLQKPTLEADIGTRDEQDGTRMPPQMRQLIIGRAKLLERQRRPLAVEQRRSDLKQLLLERSKSEKERTQGRTGLDNRPIFTEPTDKKSTQMYSLSSSDEQDEGDYHTNHEQVRVNKLKSRKMSPVDLSVFNQYLNSKNHRQRRELRWWNEILPQITQNTKDSKYIQNILLPFEEEKLYKSSKSNTTSHGSLLEHSKARKHAPLDTTSNDIEIDEIIIKEKPSSLDQDISYELFKKKTILTKKAIKSSKKSKYRTMQNKSKENIDGQSVKDTDENRINKNIDVETTSRQNELSKNRTKRNLSDKLMEIRQEGDNLREKRKSGCMINRRSNRRAKHTMSALKKDGRRTKRQADSVPNDAAGQSYDYNTDASEPVTDAAQTAEESPAHEHYSYTDIIVKSDSTEPSVSKSLQEKILQKTRRTNAQIKLLRRKLLKQRKMEERLENYLKKIKENTQEISNEIHENEVVKVRVSRDIRNHFGNNIDKEEKSLDVSRLNEVVVNELSSEENRTPVRITNFDNVESEISQDFETHESERDESVNSATKFDTYSNSISKEGVMFSNDFKSRMEDPYKIIVADPKLSNIKLDVANPTRFPVSEQNHPGGSVREEETEDNSSDEKIHKVLVDTTEPEINLMESAFQVVFHFLSNFHKRIRDFIGV